jgi:hypothetical protein
MDSHPLPQLPAYPIKQKLEVQGVIVLLLGVPPNENFPQNIFGVNEKGDVLWQIEPRPSTEPNNRYTSIRDEVGIVVAQTGDETQRKIDAKTGKVLYEETSTKPP